MLLPLRRWRGRGRGEVAQIKSPLSRSLPTLSAAGGGEGRGEVAQIKSPFPAAGHPLPARRGEGRTSEKLYQSGNPLIFGAGPFILLTK